MARHHKFTINHHCLPVEAGARGSAGLSLSLIIRLTFGPVSGGRARGEIFFFFFFFFLISAAAPLTRHVRQSAAAGLSSLAFFLPEPLVASSPFQFREAPRRGCKDSTRSSTTTRARTTEGLARKHSDANEGSRRGSTVSIATPPHPRRRDVHCTDATKRE